MPADKIAITLDRDLVEEIAAVVPSKKRDGRSWSGTGTAASRSRSKGSIARKSGRWPPWPSPVSRTEPGSTHASRREEE
jgi:hypothetical protein